MSEEKELTGEDILNLDIPEKDIGGNEIYIEPEDVYTIRDYLKALVATVWIEGEGFSGKRPFGNSGWQSTLYDTLIYYGFDDRTDVLDEAILKAIRAL